GQKQGVDPLLLAYYFIYQAVLISNDSAQIQAKTMQSNASAQNELIRQEANVNFASIPASQLQQLTIKGTLYGHWSMRYGQIIKSGWDKIAHFTKKFTKAGQWTAFQNSMKKNAAKFRVTFKTFWNPKAVAAGMLQKIGDINQGIS